MSAAALLGERFAHALTVACDERRLGAGGPVPADAVAQALGACARVLERGGSEDEAIAALLHDAVEGERRGPFLVRVRERFGDVVGDLTRAARPLEPGEGGAAAVAFYDRTDAHLASLAAGGDDAVLLIVVADAVGAARRLRASRERGEDAFAGRPGGKFGTLWAWAALVEYALTRDGRHRGMAHDLRGHVEALAGKPVTARELLAAFAIDDDADVREKGTLRRTTSHA